MNQFSLHSLREGIEAYVATQKSTVVGWCLMFIVQIDLVANISGYGVFTMRIFGWFQSWFSLGATSMIWFAIIPQVSAIIYGGYRIHQSNWKVHLRFALRESNIWNILHDGGRTVEGYALEPKDRFIMMFIELVVGFGMLRFFMPHQYQLTETLFKNNLLSMVVILALVVAATWVASSIIRKFVDDRSTTIALLIAFIAFVLFQFINPPGLNELALRVPLSSQELDHFITLQLVFLLAIVLLFAAFSLGDFNELDSPSVSLASSAETVHEFKGLADISARSMRVSLREGNNQRVLVMSKRNRQAENDYTVIVHSNLYHLPIVSRHFWFWNLSLLSLKLSDPVDFQRELHSGMYVVKADFVVSPLVQNLNNPPMYLHRVAIEAAESNLLNTNTLVAKIGDHLMREIELVLDDLFSRAFLENTSVSKLDETLFPIKKVITNQLGLIRSTKRGAFESFSLSEQKLRLEQIEKIASEVESRIRDINEAFELTEIRKTVSNFKSLSQNIVRECAEFGPRSQTHWKKIKPTDDEFFEASADFIVDTLNFEIRSISIELAPEMVEFRTKFDAMKLDVMNEFQKVWDEASADERQTIADIVHKIPNGMAARIIRENKKKDRQESISADEMDRLDVDELGNIGVEDADTFDIQAPEWSADSRQTASVNAERETGSSDQSASGQQSEYRAKSTYRPTFLDDEDHI